MKKIPVRIFPVIVPSFYLIFFPFNVHSGFFHPGNRFFSLLLVPDYGV